MIDRDAIIAEQLAAQKEREETPGRYDGVLVKDIANKVAMEHMALGALKGTNNVETSGTYDPDARLRLLAESSPQAAAAFGLRNQGYPVTVIDENGAPLVAPTRDPAVMATWWQAGAYADKWPGVPCGPEGGYFGLLLFSEGVEWFKKIATVHTPSRAERLSARPVDPVDELGVPGPVDDFDDDEPRTKPDEIRATVHAKLWLCEDVPAHRPVMQSWFGSLRGRMGQAAMMAAKPNQARQLAGAVWSWPPGETLPVGRELRKGAWSLAAIPALGAVLIVGGVKYVIRQVPALLNPPPDWLVSELRRHANG